MFVRVQVRVRVETSTASPGKVDTAARQGTPRGQSWREPPNLHATAFRVLGPVEVDIGGHWQSPGPPKQRAVLATLALNAGRSVSARSLAEVLWVEDPPVSAMRNIQMYVWRLRQLVGDRLRSRPTGYILDVEPAELDATQFLGLLAQARQAHADGDLTKATMQFAAALDVWRGPALLDLVSAGMAVQLARPLDDERIRAIRELVDVERALGRGEALLPRLHEWVAAHPLDESLRERQMRVLLDLGRPAEALSSFRTAASALSDELGAGPGPELRALAEMARQASAYASAPTVRLLPPAISSFVGRRAEIVRITELLAPRTISVPVVAIAGPGGIGKSTLAVRVGHHLARAFPDGQLYLDLGGGGPDVVRATDALRTLLVALGTPLEEVPPDPADAARLYRDRTSGRKLLLVLDNAADADQVRPLLPTGGGCAVLVTARQPLTELDRVTQLRLRTLAATDAAGLLTALIGADRVAANQVGDLSGIIDACGGLPLALRVAGARLASRPAWSLRAFGRRLSDERHRLNELRVGDVAVRTTFAVSYRHLSEDARLVFRRCGLFPGPDFGPEAIVVLAGLEPAKVSALLESLVDAALLESGRPDRYHLHDLVRIYAAERAQEEDGDNADAFEGLAAWYLRVADAADRLLTPTRGRAVPPPAVAGAPLVVLEDRVQALAWFEDERQTLLALVRAANGRGLHEIAAHMPNAMKGFFDLTRNTEDWIASHLVGLESARQLPDRTMQARVLNGLGSGYWRQERYAESIDSYREALDLIRNLGDRVKEAIVLNNLGGVYGERGDYDTAIVYLREALAIRQEVHNGLDESYALHNLGHIYHECQRFDLALPLLEQALRLRRAHGNRNGEGVTLHCLGDTLLGLSRRDDAEEAIGRALEIFAEVGDRYGRAAGLHSLGRVRSAQLRPREAAAHLSEAAVLYRDLGSTHDEATALADLRRVHDQVTSSQRSS